MRCYCSYGSYGNYGSALVGDELIVSGSVRVSRSHCPLGGSHMLAANAQAQAKAARITHVGSITFSPHGELSEPNRGLATNHIFLSYPLWAIKRISVRDTHTHVPRALMPIFKPNQIKFYTADSLNAALLFEMMPPILSSSSHIRDY